ncbi:MAG TPA: thermonuclease family protein [Pyrinomonadaceae bacterium]|nr:thermonuclease family protein [Pyrinomonadaceae bacterium]
MKNSRLLLHTVLVVFLVTITATIAAGQLRTSGNVVEVLDGKTVVIQVATGKVTVELQYIDVPEPAQALHGVVKEHVRKMLLGKPVDLETNGFAGTKATGRITANGVDISQQLLRDGAAWHAPVEKSGQKRDEFTSYAQSEALAKQEKRGIWAIPGLKPAWKVREEDEQARKEAEDAERRKKGIVVGVSEFQTSTRPIAASKPPETTVSERTQMDAWVKVFANGKKESRGLQTYNDPNGRFTSVFTSPILIEFKSAAGKEMLECRPAYVMVKRYDGGHEYLYFIGLRAIAENFRFSNTKTRMTAVVDKQVFTFSAPFGRRGTGMIGGGGIGAEEIMYFQSSKATLRKIANAKSAELRLNKLAGTLSADARDLFKELVDTTN